MRDRIESIGRKAVALPLDVADATTFDAFGATMASELERAFQREQFDYLIHNAGTSLHASIAETTIAQLDEMYNVHFKAPFVLTQRLLRLMADGGRILNVSSGLTRFSFPGSAAYASIKGAVEVLARYLAKALGGRRITANTIAPGAIATDFSGGMLRDNAEVNRMVASFTTLGRVGLPDDIGAAVAALLGPEGAWMNGQRLEFAGGEGSVGPQVRARAFDSLTMDGCAFPADVDRRRRVCEIFHLSARKRMCLRRSQEGRRHAGVGTKGKLPRCDAVCLLAFSSRAPHERSSV